MVWRSGLLRQATVASALHPWLKEHAIEWCQFPQLALQQPEAPDDGTTRLKQAFLSGWRGEAELAFERRFQVIGRESTA